MPAWPHCASPQYIRVQLLPFSLSQKGYSIRAELPSSCTYLFPTPPHHSSPPPHLARLFTAAVVHRDVPHLCGNLLSAAPACLSRERHLGSSLRMATELVTLTALSHGLCVGWAVFQRRCMDRPQLYFRTGCVGLSAVVYAVQVRM